MAKKKGVIVEIAVPDKVEASIGQDSTINIKGPKGECKKRIAEPLLSITIKDNKFVLETKNSTKNEKKRIYSNEEHIKNIIAGVINEHEYILKICKGHFPMTVQVANNQLIIKNFLGEKFPRTLNLKDGVKVKVDGEHVKVTSVDKELAGTTASDIELMTKRPGFDKRIFQDGLYIISKDGKQIK